MSLYYTPPPDEIFNEIKLAAIDVWKTFDDTYQYATGKINRIKDIPNVSDNAMYIVAMFDLENQAVLARLLSAEARWEIASRMRDGEMPDFYNPFL